MLSAYLTLDRLTELVTLARELARADGGSTDPDELFGLYTTIKTNQHGDRYTDETMISAKTVNELISGSAAELNAIINEIEIIYSQLRIAGNPNQKTAAVRKAATLAKTHAAALYSQLRTIKPVV